MDLASQDDSWKVRQLLRKLGPAEHGKYANYILPKHLRDRTFDETVVTLGRIFGQQSPLSKIRYQCLNLVNNESDD